MARYRLRFLLQEFDVVGPDVTIGRSPECHITIEDPLISRQHARIVVSDDRPRVSDLGSRNGVRVNGRQITGEHELRHGDRIRLGTQELVFLVVSRRARTSRTTGFMRVCHACATPYPENSQHCPHCGARETPDEDTISGFMVEPSRSWTFQLLGEVIERALETGRAAEADRVLRRAARELDLRVERGGPVEEAQLDSISALAVRVGRLQGATEWLAWALGLCRRLTTFPGPNLVAALVEAESAGDLPDLPEVVEEFLAWHEQHGGGGGGEDRQRLEGLVRMTRPMDVFENGDESQPG